jgi:transcriptional regulator with XRE-family HTH domain
LEVFLTDLGYELNSRQWIRRNHNYAEENYPTQNYQIYLALSSKMLGLVGCIMASEGYFLIMKAKSGLLVSLGGRIRSLRKAKGLSQEALGERSGLNPKYIGQIERAETNPSVETLQRIAEGLGVDLSDLFAFLPGKRRAQGHEPILEEIISLARDQDIRTVRLVRDMVRELVKWSKEGR